MTILAISIAIRVRNILLELKQAIINLNLFDDHSRDLFRTRRGRIATRLYILLLIGTTSVLLAYTSIPMQTITKTIQSPPYELYEVLQRRYQHTLQCPCRVVSIPYAELIEVKPTYHQLCGSDFVQPQWYENLPYVTQVNAEYSVFASGSSHFRTLALFCETANLTIAAVTRRFSSMMFTNAQVLTAELFDSQMNASIDIILKSTRVEFLSTMSLIDAVLQGNQYVGRWATNIVLEQRNVPQLNPLALQSVRIIALSTMGTTESGKICYCARNPACHMTNILEEFGVTVGGVRTIGCSSVYSVLESKLDCWYNNTCFNEMQKLFRSYGIPIQQNVTLLDPKVSSRFPPNTPIRMIVDEIMVERWNQSVSYEKFYQNCHPAYCSFTYQERIYVAYIITTVTGLFGGLSMIFQLLSPVLVKIYFKCRSRTDLNNASQASDNQETTGRKLSISFDCKRSLRSSFIRTKVTRILNDIMSAICMKVFLNTRRLLFLRNYPHKIVISCLTSI